MRQVGLSRQNWDAQVELEKWLRISARAGASDLHLSAGLAPTLRVDGKLQRLDAPALSARDAAQLVDAAMNAEQREAFAQLSEADFACEAAGARFRGHAFHHLRGIGAAFRTIPLRVPDLAELGLGPTFERIAALANGLVLVTGPTGSGKSTTTAALLDCINANRQDHIVTIEDPIEFVHQNQACLVSQRQVHRHTQSFDAALRAALREDPDVILVGEMRDLETIRLALRAAETGHLVFATLHTQSAPTTIARIVDVFPAGEQQAVRTTLAECLQAVVAQKLLPRIGGGRIAAHEVLLATPAVRNLIRENQTPQLVTAMQTGAATGMQTLEQCIEDLERRGLAAANAMTAGGA